MIITETTEAVNTTTLAVQNFSILDSPALYKLMYTSMYEDKEKIVLQELAANALDAHRSAGITDTAVVITLPTEENPELIVKDFGIGMSLKTLNAIYPVYGASTKRSDNTSIGGFGLGSKSPFALTNSFIVESTHEGITSTVSCFLDNGKPKFSVFTSENVGKADGTEIRVPVTSDNSQRRLSQHTETLFTLWPVQPIICGVVKNVKNPELLVTDLLYFSPSDNFANSHRRENIIAVGPFTYKLPIGIAERLAESDEMRRILKQFHNLLCSDKKTFYTVVPKFEIGELELSPSRELIESTEDNYQKVVAKITAIQESTFKDAKEDYSAVWFLEFLEALENNGVFVETYSGNRVFVGVDKKFVSPIFDKILNPNPNMFNYMWAQAEKIPYDKIVQEFKDLPIEVSKRAEKLLKSHVYDTENNYGTRSTIRLTTDIKSPKLDLNAVMLTGLSQITYRYRASTSNRVLEVDRSLTIHNTERLRVTKNYRTYPDVRTIPVFLGDEGVRQKFYHWWREMEDDVCNTGFKMFPNAKEYEDEVIFFDKHQPIPDEERCNKTYSIKDIEKVWENRPRKEKVTPSAKKAAVKLDEETTVIGEHYELGLCVKTDFTVKNLREMLKGDAEVVMVASNARTTNVVAAMRHILPDNITSKYPAVVISKKFQNKKVVKDLLASSKVHYLGYSGTCSLCMHEVHRRILKDDLPAKILSIRDKNTAILDLLNFQAVLNRYLLPAFKDVLTSVEGVPSKYLAEKYSNHVSANSRDALAKLLPEKLLSKILLVGYNAERGRTVENILSAADVKMLKHSINFHKGLRT
jgi:hypothetical protein